MAKHTLIGAKIDWITFTIKTNDPAFEYLVKMWEYEIDKEAKDGEGMAFETRNSYYGPRSRHWFYGMRHDGYQFQVTGERAHDAAEILKGENFVLKMTRIDIRADIMSDKELGNFHFRHFNEVRKHEKQTNAKQAKTIRITDAPNKGATIEIGNRKSGDRNCAYDKDAEQDFTLGANVKRNESQTGRLRAPQVWLQILDCKDLEQFCLDFVVERWKRDGIKLPIRKMANPYKYPSAYKPKGSQEVAAAWLIRCAAQTFKRVKNEDLRKAVAQAFGLGYKPLPQPKADLSVGAREALSNFNMWREARLAGQRESQIKRGLDENV